VRAAFRSTFRWLLPLALTCPLFGAGCTFIGVDQPAARDAIDFGALDHVPLCAYLDDGVTRDNVDAIVGSWNDDEGRTYKLNFDVVT
jgi:hypothetical protein